MTVAGAPTAGRTVNLGRGWRVPYPEPGTLAATKVGRANVRSDTKPEVLLRQQLHAAGLRFRKDYLIRCDGLRTHADVAFTKKKIAVYVDGCFWHCCPMHFVMPKTNLGYWEPKLAANVARDKRMQQSLAREGWKVIRLWEHQVADELVLQSLVAFAKESSAGIVGLTVELPANVPRQAERPPSPRSG